MNLFKKKYFKEEPKRIINSLKYALEGIKSALKTEKNLFNHFITMIIVIVLGLLLRINSSEWIICILLFGLVISGELINTAIETTVDLFTLNKNSKAKLAKDVAAGAVLTICITALVIGLIIFVPKLSDILINIKIN